MAARWWGPLLGCPFTGVDRNIKNKLSGSQCCFSAVFSLQRTKSTRILAGWKGKNPRACQGLWIPQTLPEPPFHNVPISERSHDLTVPAIPTTAPGLWGLYRPLYGPQGYQALSIAGNTPSLPLMLEEEEGKKSQLADVYQLGHLSSSKSGNLLLRGGGVIIRHGCRAAG